MRQSDELIFLLLQRSLNVVRRDRFAKGRGDLINGGSVRLET